MFVSANRSTEQEILDGNDYSFEEYRRTMGELARINRLSSGYKPTFAALERVIAKSEIKKPLKILDVGFGFGDSLHEIGRWADRRKIRVDLCGVDINPWAREVAERDPRRDTRSIRFQTADVFSLEDEKFDLIISSLFTHHLSDQELVRFLGWMTRHSTLGWFINDLHRHPVPYIVIKLASRALGYSRMITNDGPISVARSFRRKEWREYLRESGLSLERTRIDWYWPFRYGVFYDCTS